MFSLEVGNDYHHGDLHVHLSDPTTKENDAYRNSVKNIIDWLKNTPLPISVLGLVKHDDFPTKGEVDQIEKTSVRVFPGIEATVLVDNNLLGLPRVVHLIGLWGETIYFPEKWPFKKPEWSGSRKRLETARQLPPIDEVLDVIKEYNGLAIFPHPSSWFPWASIRPKEIKSLLNEGQIDPKQTAVELNGMFFNIPFHNSVMEMARDTNLTIVGGSDAHTPGEIGRKMTIWPKQSNNPFADLVYQMQQDADKKISDRGIRVVGKSQTVFQYLKSMSNK